MKEFETIIPLIRDAAGAERAADLMDDVATLSSGPRRIVTVDALVEDVHFLPSDPIGDVARKLVRVNVSDILAKAARPSEALLTLGWPDSRGESALRAFIEALGKELQHWGVALIGGDTVRCPDRLVLSLTMTGDCLGEGPVRRSGGQVGDGLWVTGIIGAGGLGLAAALAGDEASPFLAHYRAPVLPPREVAALIHESASASMDVSDGLLGDGLKLADASGCGLEIELRQIPFAQAPADRAAGLELASAGDDYQCLFSVPQARETTMASLAADRGIRITRVGRLVGTRGLTVLEAGQAIALPARIAFEHGAE